MLIYRFGRKNPDRIAIIDTNLEKYTYRTLNRMADSIRNMFPVSNPSRVGILSGAGASQIAAILAVIKSGGAYVPLDPSLNGSAIRRAMSAAGIDFVIADTANATRLGTVSAVVLPSKIEVDETFDYAPMSLDKDTPACAMPTLTGGFEQLNCGAVRRHARFLCDQFGIKSSDVVLQSHLASSPMFLAEVFATMMKGATLAILPEKNRGYAKAVADFAERAGVTVICDYRPMVDELGLLGRLPSRLRMLLGLASDRLSSTLTNFNKSDAWRGWFSILIPCGQLSPKI